MEAETKVMGRTISSTLIEHGNVQYFIEELGHVVLRAERGSNPEFVAFPRPLCPYSAFGSDRILDAFQLLLVV